MVISATNSFALSGRTANCFLNVDVAILNPLFR
nr:MAG TPA: hypothetical protein [Caudoviricetes sp.]